MARRRRFNEVGAMPLTIGTTTLSSGTADGDVVTVMALPSDGYIGHSVLQITSPGTGTALITAAWYTAASRGGTRMSDAHTPVLDLDQSGTFAEADGSRPTTLFRAGQRMFLNFDFDAGSASGAASIVGAITLIL
jgi:hypothetical protein